MKTSNTILIAAATAVVGIWRAERRHREEINLSKKQHRQQLRLGTAALHQRLLAAIAADPEHWQLWAKEGITPEELGKMVRVNSQVSLTHLNFELGLISSKKLYVQARSLMERPAVQDFWSKTRAFRSEECGDWASQKFISVFDREHAAAIINS
ncbi:DUF6082 family protein [Streptomyces sp. NPDC058877]|uniref:DUF6082 family protein n=1 Tax=unclassified Streptomyces TaxID=2593676 RepID=UPI0036B66ED2